MRRRSIGIALLTTSLLVACGLSVVGSVDGVEGLDAGVPAPGVDATAADGQSTTATDSPADADAPDAPGCSPDLKTDPLNCGACNVDCKGATCAGGACQPTLFADGEVGARGMTVAGARLVWTREAAGLVRAKPFAGGDAVTLANISGPTDVVADGQTLFVSRRANERVTKLDANGNEVWSVTPYTTPTGLAIDGNTVYVTLQNEDTLDSMSTNGNQFQQRSQSLNFPSDVAVAGGKMYVACSSGILLASPTNGVAHTVLSPVKTFQDAGADLIHSGLTVDGATIYFTIGSLGLVASVPTAGGVARVLARNQQDPQGIAVTPTAVYWANRGAGAIMTLPR